MASPSFLSWRHLGEDAFNRIVEALLVRHYRDDPTRHAYAVDGRGGDEGLDVAVEHHGVVEHVYQLKHFPEGFSGAFAKARRPQIKKSFATAMDKHSPDDWTLVVPANGTLTERRHVSTLRNDRTVRIHFMGRAELDGLLAAYPEIAAWAVRDPLVDTLRLLREEQAELVRPDDLSNRVQALAAKVDDRSPNWGMRFAVDENGVTHTLFAKRPDAAEREPLFIDLTARFAPEHEKLRQQFVSMLEWGSADPLVLPPEVASKVVHRGPEWFAAEHTDVFFEFMPMQIGAPKTVELRILRDGAVISSLRGEATMAAPGTVGATLHTVFRRCLTMDWRVPAEGTAGNVDVSFALERAENATDAAAVIRLLREFRPMHELELLTDGQRVFLTQSGDVLEMAPDDVLAAWIDDLAYFERDLGITIAVPEEVSTRDRVLLRIARMVREGKCALWPFSESLTGVLNGVIDDTVRMVLSGPFIVGLSADDYRIEVSGIEYAIGDIQIIHPHAQVVGAAEHLAALEAGTGQGRESVTRPADDTPFRIYSPSKWADRWQDPAKRLVPSPWGLPDVPEPPSLAAIVEAAGTTLAPTALPPGERGP